APGPSLSPPCGERAGVRGAPVSYRKPLLLRRFLHRHRERLAAGPGMLSDIEQHALGAVQLDLEAAGALRVRLVHVVLAAERLDLRRRRLDILDQDAEMVQPGVVHALADLVGL